MQPQSFPCAGGAAGPFNPAESGRLPAPDAPALARSAELRQRIEERVASAGGWLDFASYMQMALYEPGLGYYDAAGRKFGAAGDFVTAPEISPLFGRSLAAQLAQAFAHVPARVLEFGAGTGALAQTLLAELAARGTPVAQYDILEISGDLRARQQARLAGLPVRWLDRLPEDYAGVVIANEVLDVLPVRLFVRGRADLLERGVCVQGDALRLAGRPADGELRAAVAVIESAAGALPEGYGSEWCPLAGAWIAALARSLARGLVLLIDYGFPRHEYYHPQRTMGTVMCHYRQRAHSDPLWLPGLNDITAHVDFSACARAATDQGLDVLGYTAQSHFLMNCGVLELFSAAPGPAQAAALQRLISEAEMGELIKVLALGRGLPDEMLGFARGDRRHRL